MCVILLGIDEFVVLCVVFLCVYDVVLVVRCCRVVDSCCCLWCVCFVLLFLLCLGCVVLLVCVKVIVACECGVVDVGVCV